MSVNNRLVFGPSISFSTTFFRQQPGNMQLLIEMAVPNIETPRPYTVSSTTAGRILGS